MKFCVNEKVWNYKTKQLFTYLLTAVVSAARLVSCENCEKFYLVSSEGDCQPHKVPAVDDLCADRQPFLKYNQPPVPTKVTLRDLCYHVCLD